MSNNNKGITVYLLYFLTLMCIALILFVSYHFEEDKDLQKELISQEQMVEESVKEIKVVENSESYRPVWWTPDHEILVQAIEQVESDGDMNAIGDGGKSIGSFQIGKLYWIDAMNYNDSRDNSSIRDYLRNGNYEDTAANRDYAIQIMIAYWERYAYNTNPENLARLHNGGPHGPDKQSTLPYWYKVKHQMSIIKKRDNE